MKTDSKNFIGVLRLILADGKEVSVSVYRDGGSVYLSDVAAYGILVHPSNVKTQEGWIREYRLIRGVSVASSEFVTPERLQREETEFFKATSKKRS